MPKAKPKAPKTEKMWMCWIGGKFDAELEVYRRDDSEFEPISPLFGKYIRVRIVPEAEYQRLIAATKRNEREAFAMAAMQGLLASGRFCGIEARTGADYVSDGLPEIAASTADALIVALNATTKRKDKEA